MIARRERCQSLAVKVWKCLPMLGGLVTQDYDLGAAEDELVIAVVVEWIQGKLQGDARSVSGD